MVGKALYSAQRADSCKQKLLAAQQKNHIRLLQPIIQGVTLSDWAERLSGILSTCGADHCLCYAPYLQPLTYNGVKSVAIDKKLQEVNADAFDFLLGFAREN